MGNDRHFRGIIEGAIGACNTVLALLTLAPLAPSGALVLDRGAGRAKSPVTGAMGVEPEGRERWR